MTAPTKPGPRPRSREDDNCTAEKHGTYRAWSIGCICPSAVASNARRSEMNKAAWQRMRERGYRRGQNVYQRRILAKTGGKMVADPRAPWRTIHFRVDRNNLWMLVRGFVDSPTRLERMVAVLILDQVRVPNGPKCSRPLERTEIARRLGVTEETVHRMRALPEQLRGQRTARRLAEVQWRAAAAGPAAARKEKVRAQHEAAHARRAAR